jgi:hypothetical protein
MSITKALVFDKVEINENDYTPHLSESAEVTVEPVDQQVLNGQTLPSAWDVNFSVDLLNTAIASNINVYTDSSEAPTLANIKFVGTAGASNLEVKNVIISVIPNFEGERTAYTLTGSKRVTSIPTTVLVS